MNSPTPQEKLQSADAGTPHVSTFARVGLLMYTFLIVYASLYPFSGWRDIGLAPWAFLSMPLPYYWTGFDVATNIAGYAPFGILMVFALYPRLRGLRAAIIAAFAGMLLSGTMEAIQTFLPSRVSSNLDFLTNFAGVCLGAIAGVLLSPICLEQSRLLQLRHAWFVPEAGRGLIVIGLWPLAQIYPQDYLFGHGQMMRTLSDWLSDWIETPLDLATMLTGEMQLSAQEYWLSETLITAGGMTGALLAFSCLLRKQAPKAALILTLLLSAIAVKMLANAVLFMPANAIAWLTPGAKGGLLIGALMVGGLAYAPPVAQKRLAVVCLLVSFVAINLVPANPYFLSTMQTWAQGKFLNFNGAAHFLSMFWPVFALWFLLHPALRAKRK